MDFYKVLQAVLDEKGLSIPDAARLSGLSDSTIRTILTRKNKSVSLEVAFKLSSGLGVSIGRLNGEPAKTLRKEVPIFNSSEMALEVSTILKNARVSANLTQQQVADVLKVKKNTISNYENNVSSPDMDSLAVLCDLYGLDMGATLNAVYGSAGDNVGAPPIPLITPQLKILSDALGCLNEDGRNKLLDYATDLVSSGRYIETSSVKGDTEKMA